MLMKATQGNYTGTSIASKTVYLRSNDVGLERSTNGNVVNTQVPNSVPNQSFQNTTQGDLTKNRSSIVQKEDLDNYVQNFQYLKSGIKKADDRSNTQNMG